MARRTSFVSDMIVDDIESQRTARLASRRAREQGADAIEDAAGQRALRL